MKKYILIFSILILILCSGCTWAGDGSDTAQEDIKIKTDFTIIPGEDNLYYANDTKIVYWIGGSYMLNGYGDDYTTSYITVWYSPNGKLYRYEPVTLYMLEHQSYGEMIEIESYKLVEIN